MTLTSCQPLWSTLQTISSLLLHRSEAQRPHSYRHGVHQGLISGRIDEFSDFPFFFNRQVVDRFFNVTQATVREHWKTPGNILMLEMMLRKWTRLLPHKSACLCVQNTLVSNKSLALAQGSANYLGRGPKNEMILLSGGPQLSSKKKHSERFNIVLLYPSKNCTLVNKNLDYNNMESEFKL